MTTGTLPARSRTATRIPAGVAGGVAILVGGLVLYGWVDRRIDLVQLRAGQVPMQFNTALCLLLLGLALLLLVGRRYRAAVLPLTLATYGAAATVAQYLTGLSLGVDTALFDPWLTVGTEAPGRMPANTAACLTTLGITGLLLASLRGRVAAPLAAGIGGSLVAGVAFVALFGYTSDVPSAYAWRAGTAMAPATAAVLLLLGIGWVAAGWGRATRAGAPLWLPVPVSIGALATTLFLWQSLTNVGGDGSRTVPLDRAAGAILGIGLVFSALLAVATWFGQEARRRRLLAEQRADRDALLRAAYGAISSAPELDAGFTAFADAVRPGLAFDRAALSLVDGDAVRIAASAGATAGELPAGTAIPAGDALVVNAVTSGEPYVLSDAVEEYPDSVAARLGVHSFAAAPIVVAGEVRALLSFASRAPRAFGPGALRLLEELVASAGGSLYTLAALGAEQRTSARLRELDTLKNEFVGVVAHDLRSPMTVIAGYVDTVIQRWDVLSDDMKRDLLDVASRNTKRLSVLVEDVLQVARIESGDFPYEIAPFDLGVLVHRTVGEMSAARPDRPVVADVPASLPAALGDEDRQWRVLTNLVSNAQKFSPPDAPVVVSVRPQESFLEVCVADRGPGIPEEDLPRLFGKFARLASAPGGEKGTGLGLYICKALVEAQGGTIGVTSRVGEGTTLRYTVPRTRERS